ncbi:5845_t:CDS:2, partial [Gigaspora margarita]
RRIECQKYKEYLEDIVKNDPNNKTKAVKAKQVSYCKMQFKYKPLFGQEQVLQASGQSSSSRQSGSSSDQSDPPIQQPYRLIKHLKDDISNFELDIDETKLLKVIGTIDNCSTKSEKSEFIFAVLIGVLSTFDKVCMRKEYYLSGSNDK